MQKKTIENIVSDIAIEIVNKNNFELVDVEYVKEGSNWYLRIYIDKVGGILIDDCQVISEELNEKLEDIKDLSQSYFLEVSSPGIDRPFKKDNDYNRNLGKMVEIKLFEPQNNNKIFVGTLVSLLDNIVTINVTKIGELKFEKDKIASAKYYIKF